MTTQGHFDIVDSVVRRLNIGDTFYASVPGEQSFYVGTFEVSSTDPSLAWVKGRELDDDGNYTGGVFDGSVDDRIQWGFGTDIDEVQARVDDLNRGLSTPQGIAI